MLLGLAAWLCSSSIAFSADAADSRRFWLLLPPLPSMPPLLYYHDNTAADIESHWQALGPFFESRHAANGSVMQALPRPFYTYRHRGSASATNKRDIHMLWPAAEFQFDNDSCRYRILLALLQHNDQAWKTWLLPLVFAGNSRDHGAYAAVFPLGGKINNIAGCKRVSFVLFPLYISSERASSQSQALLWPVFSRTTGPKIDKWRIFPFYGTATTATGRQQFVLWPLLNWGQQQFPDNHSGRGWLLLPFGGYYRVSDDTAGTAVFESHSVLWPFFSRSRSADSYKLHCPWPFYQIETRPDYQERSYWPFYSVSTRPNSRNTSIAWPIYQHWHQFDKDQEKSMRWLLPFYWSRSTRQGQQTIQSQQKLWPLFSHERQQQSRAWRAPDLWPQVNSEPIERNYAPLWTLLQYTNHDDHQLKFSAFWNWFSYRSSSEQRQWELFPLFRYEREPQAHAWSIGRGLLGWRRAAEQRQLRLLWLPLRLP